MELNSRISLVTAELTLRETRSFPTNPTQNVRTRALLATIQDAAATDGSMKAAGQGTVCHQFIWTVS